MPLKALPHALSPRGQTEQGSATQRSLSASMQSSRRVTTHLGRALLDDRLGRCLLRRALLLHAVAASRQHRTIALRQRPRERTPKSANGAGHVQVAAKSVDACAGTLLARNHARSVLGGIDYRSRLLGRRHDVQCCWSRCTQSKSRHQAEEHKHTHIHQNSSDCRHGLGREGPSLAHDEDTERIVSQVSEYWQWPQRCANARQWCKTLPPPCNSRAVSVGGTAAPTRRCGAEARRGASARTDRQGNRAGTDTQAQHLLPPTLPSVGRRWRAPAIRRPFWLGPTQPRWECAHPRGWARRAMGIAMFSRHRHARATARGTVFPHRPLAFPALVPALTLSCPVGLVGSATQITRSLETRTESPRLPLSLQQCHSASHRFPLA